MISRETRKEMENAMDKVLKEVRFDADDFLDQLEVACNSVLDKVDIDATQRDL